MKKLLTLLATLLFFTAGSVYAHSVKLYFKYKVSGCNNSTFSTLNFSNLKMKISGLGNIKNYYHGSPYLSRFSGNIPGFQRTGTLNRTLQMAGQYKYYSYYSPNPSIGFASTTNKNLQVAWIGVWSSYRGSNTKKLSNSTWSASVHLLTGGKTCVLRFKTK